MNTFCLPDLGEGLPEGEICKWHVQEGQFIKADDPLVSIETAKAVVEVPSPFTGKVAKLYGKEGDIIPTGSPLVDFEGEKKASSTVAGEIKETNEIIVEKAATISGRSGQAKALPAVRALAKKLNVDLNLVVPTGVDNTITAEDVKKAHEQVSQAGPIEPLRGVRRAMAMAMTQSHAEVVPVTVYDDADITPWVGTKAFSERVLQALAKACQEEKSLNAWYDSKAMGRRVFDHVHVGLAMDTNDGLFVPVIKDVQTKSQSQLREEIDQLKQEVKARTIAPERMQGATIVLSNFGNFAGRYASPIIVVPTVAILAVGMIREAVLPVNGEPRIRTILPLSLTFDHRAVTGGEATRFLKTVIESLKGS